MKPVVVRLLIVFAVYFAVQGGEYSTYDLYRQRQREASLVRVVDSLRQDLDSLQALKRLIDSDAATQERIAREEFGMVRDKELLFRFLHPDSVKR